MTDNLWTARFWKDAIERAVKTGAQTAVLALGGEAFNVWQIDWVDIGGVSLGGFLLSILTSLSSNVLPFGDKGSASAVKLEEA